MIIQVIHIKHASLKLFSYSVNVSSSRVVPWPIPIDAATLSTVVIIAVTEAKHPFDTFTERRSMTRVLLTEDTV